MKIPRDIKNTSEYVHNSEWEMAQKIVQLLIDEEYTIEEVEIVCKMLEFALKERRIS